MTRSLWFQVTAAAGFAALGVVTGIVATSDPEGHTHSHAAEPQQADAPVELSEIAQRNLGVEVAPIQPTRFVRTRAVAATIVEPPEASLPLFAPNDVDAERELTLGMIALTAFSAPNLLATCVFNGSAGDPPVSGDFPITIDDSTDGNGDPITAVITVTVTPVP